MPTYQFRCPDGTIIERFYKISEVPASIPTPDGQGEAVRIISGGAGLIFKGTGFYITDYRSDSYKNAAKADSAGGDKGSSSASSDSKSGSGSAAKPAKGE